MARPPGRPRTFATANALDAATQVFVRHGYAAATIPRLEQAMGLHRPSLYGAFGSKPQLYKHALAHDIERRARAWRQALTDAEDLADGLLGALESLLDDPHGRPRLGLALAAGLDGAAAPAGAHDLVKAALEAMAADLAIRLGPCSPAGESSTSERAQGVLDRLLGLALRVAVTGRPPTRPQVSGLTA